jgi:hypothetical protein
MIAMNSTRSGLAASWNPQDADQRMNSMSAGGAASYSAATFAFADSCSSIRKPSFKSGQTSSGSALGRTVPEVRR